MQNEAMFQLDGDDADLHEFLYNYSKEEIYNLLSTKLGIMKGIILDMLNTSLYDCDVMQYLAGLKFVRKDISKLKEQKTI